MVLTDSKIKEALENGELVIEGFKEANLGPASYDMTLHNKCKVYHPGAVDLPTRAKLSTAEFKALAEGDIFGSGMLLDVRKENYAYEFTMPEEGMILYPNHLYLYCCNEKIGLNGPVCATVMGKSSLGRLGLDIHVCAGFGDPGFNGSLVLEMRTIYPLRIYPNMKICQLKFEQTTGLPEVMYGDKPGSKYAGQQGVQASLYHKNFSDAESANHPHT